jgi:hypothetical protein
VRKAHDRGRVGLSRAIMIRLGFHRLWVEMVMRLITIASFSIIFNGRQLQSFKPSRGIRQSDSISPLSLFVGSRGSLVPVKT